jgi:tetratricopeptide (TPR) repeat protein
MRALFIAIGLALTASGAVLADPAIDCSQEEDQDRTIRGCTHFIDVVGRGNIVVSLNRRGLAYCRKGEYDRAIADFEQAIRLSPNYSDGYNSRAWTLFKAGQAEEAKLDADKSIELAPNSDNFDTRGHILLALGDTEGALDDFNEALRENADSISSLWGRGQAYEAQGLPAEAITDFNKAIELRALDFDDREAQEKARARLVVLQAAR